MLTAKGDYMATAAPPIAPPSASPNFQLVPHSIEAEEALLGGLILDPSMMLEVSYLSRADFYLLNNGFLFEAMAKLFARHGGYDNVTVTQELASAGHLEDIGGAAAIMDFINATPTSYGVPEYAATVYRHSISRQVINKAQRIAQDAYKNVTNRSGDALVSEAIGQFSEIDAARNVSNGPRPVNDGVTDLLDSMEEIERTGQVGGLQTGIKTIDSILGGLQKSQLYLLAGRPGMGKSALAIQIATNITKRGVPVLYFSLEMSRNAIAGRIISSICNVPYDQFSRPGIGDKWPQILEAGEQVAQLPLLIDDTGLLSVEIMRSIAQKMMVTEPVGLIILDHLGLARVNSARDSYEATSQISHSLLALGKQLDLPVLALSQLSRACENRNDKRPMLADLRDTGKLEEDADGVLFLYRDEVYNPDTEFPNLGEVNVAKNRGGKTGIATLYANMPTNRFLDLETRKVKL